MLSEAEKRKNRAKKIARLLKQWDETVQYVIQSSRKQRKLSQPVVADRMAWTVDIVSNVEKGRRAITVSEFIVLAHELGVDPEVMFRRVMKW